jgi:hypothetical protein
MLRAAYVFKHRLEVAAQTPRCGSVEGDGRFVQQVLGFGSFECDPCKWRQTQISIRASTTSNGEWKERAAATAENNQ